MKSILLMCGVVTTLLLSGCGMQASHVEMLKNWSFQYNEETNDYSIFFELTDKIIRHYQRMLMLIFES